MKWLMGISDLLCLKQEFDLDLLAVDHQIQIN